MIVFLHNSIKKTWVILLINISLFLCACKKEDFSFNLIKKPILSELSITSNSASKTELNAILLSNGNDENTVKGFCYSYSDNPTINDNKFIINNSKQGSFSQSFKWDTAVTKYFRAFTINKLGTFYSNILPVEWPGDNQNTPIISTLSVNNISFFNCQISSQLISDGGLPITDKGILISTSSLPVFSNSTIISDKSATNFYKIDVSSLKENTNYYVRAYSKNMAFTGYGSTISFKTKKFYTIGDYGPSGGKIFYSKIDTIGGWNFLEAAPQTYNTPVVWAADSSELEITKKGIGFGEINTLNIVNSLGSDSIYAAYVGSIYTWGDYNDWFLPSIDELVKIHENLYLKGLQDFIPNADYWSSTEDEFYTQNAWCVSMNKNGSKAFTSHKKNKLYIKLIRKF